ncbi:UBP-type zinc finger domain-containing protein [Arcticibacter eurypsychrophilus]|uniref:UBP-type zinc finger domain-containing protein n=1 Tax=Arcticibacter eurypsychrophilus TaxID=1434752 RepID=UPI00084DF512|nr:UBP-type zinc finger domain-containing protein [Arcticibacter eurypsychrophilus]
MIDQDSCSHIKAIKKVVVGKNRVCEECIKIQGNWVHLRTCQTCGQTLCCDSSTHKHMTKHYHETQHPVIASAEKGERWLWCYPDEKFVDY